MVAEQSSEPKVAGSIPARVMVIHFAALAQLVERGAYRLVSIKRQNAKVAGSRPASSTVLRIHRILKTDPKLDKLYRVRLFT